MDVVFLSRVQFALHISFHYIFPPLTIGLGLALIVMEGMYLITKSKIYENMTRFWVKIFALIFALGVATGVVNVFGFGTNWSRFSSYVGDVFGSLLGAEGIFAFTLEAGFLGILLFGWNKVSSKVHFLATCMVALGAHLSAFWIVCANSWMQTPAGYQIVGKGAESHAVLTSFSAALFNPSALTRMGHVILGCWLSGAFLILSVSAYYLLKNRHIDFAKKTMKIGLILGGISILLQLWSGDSSARGAQPAKLAAFEGVYKTESYTPMYIFGHSDPETQTVSSGLKIPGLLSFLMYRNFKTPVQGLDQIPKEDWPLAAQVFQTYHLMIILWGVMFLILLWAWVKLWKGTLFTDSKWILRILVVSVICPMTGNMLGWFSAEMGRQPWLVYGLLRTSQGITPSIVAGQVIGSLIMFISIFILLFIMFVFLLDRKIRNGPDDHTDAVDPYRDPFSDKKVKVEESKC